MAQRDYLLRLIEQAGQIFIRIRKLILGGAPEERVEDELREAAGRTGLDLDLVRLMTGESLLLVMSPGGDPEPARCWTTAELLALDGDAAEARGEPERALESWAKALLLFHALDPDLLGGLPEARERIREMEARLGEGG